MWLTELFKGSAYKEHERVFEEIVEIQKRHNPTTDEKLLRKAFEFALRAHEGQKRKDGRDYVVHPLAVAKTCGEYWMDDLSVASALLHDTIEDAKEEVRENRKEELLAEFGPEIARIVYGVSKLKKKKEDPFDRQIEALKNVLSTSAKDDIRTIIIKIFDRHNNVQTLDVFRKEEGGKEKQARIDYETRHFYVPIAGRLGLFKIAREMEDSLMKALNGAMYKKILRWTRAKQSKVKPQIDNVVRNIKMRLEEMGIDCVEKFYHRGIYQIYTQMQKEKVGLKNLEDLIAYNLTLIVPTEDDCYRTLGQVHRLYPHLRDSIFDYISNPKVNGYRSLHTVILVDGLPKLQVLIRTPEMDTRNHLGLIADLRENNNQREELIDWIKQLVSSFDVIGPRDFLEVTSKVQYREIEVLTPQGGRIRLPEGSTALDFAFRIHSEIGLHAKSAIIDGEERELICVLEGGQRVKIETDPRIQPQPHWLGWVNDSTSKLALKKYFKRLERKNIEEEEERLAEFCKEKLGIKLSNDGGQLNEVITGIGYKSKLDFLKDLYTGRLMYEYVVPHLVMSIGLKECRRLCEILVKEGAIQHEDAAKLMRESGEAELRNLLKGALCARLVEKTAFSEYVEIPDLKYPLPVHFAVCCRPQPPSDIIAVTSKEKGAVIHRADCSSITPLREYGAPHLAESRWKKLPPIRKLFIKIEGNDRPGLLYDLAHIFREVGSNILEIFVKVVEDNRFTGEILFELSDIVEKEALAEKLATVSSLKLVEIRMVQ